MNQFYVLLKREWWEWRKTILWIIGIFTLLLTLSLLPVSRLSNRVADHVNGEDLHGEIGDIVLNGKDIGPLLEKAGGIDGLKSVLEDEPEKVLVPYGLGLITGFHMIHGIVFFIALFFLSDSLFKERSDGSTLYYRSQPVSDHGLILSKVAAALIGIIGVTVTMSIILLVYTKLNFMALSDTVADVILPVISRVKTMDLFVDMVTFQLVTLIWLSPLILFLIMISALVKNRPLIIGIGGPVLLGIILQLVFGNHELFSMAGHTFERIASIQKEQLLIYWDMSIDSGGQLSIFDSFAGYLFTMRTLLSLLVAGGFYGLTWWIYRKNIPTS